MAERHEKTASLMARAVLKMRDPDKATAVGAIEELLHDDKEAPQVRYFVGVPDSRLPPEKPTLSPSLPPPST